eukprot:29054-Pelagococcus_subviridis.AAC.2
MGTSTQRSQHELRVRSRRVRDRDFAHPSHVDPRQEVREPGQPRELRRRAAPELSLLLFPHFFPRVERQLRPQRREDVLVRPPGDVRAEEGVVDGDAAVLVVFEEHVGEDRVVDRVRVRQRAVLSSDEKRWLRWSSAGRRDAMDDEETPRVGGTRGRRRRRDRDAPRSSRTRTNIRRWTPDAPCRRGSRTARPAAASPRSRARPSGTTPSIDRTRAFGTRGGGGARATRREELGRTRRSHGTAPLACTGGTTMPRGGCDDDARGTVARDGECGAVGLSEPADDRDRCAR